MCEVTRVDIVHFLLSLQNFPSKFLKPSDRFVRSYKEYNFPLLSNECGISLIEFLKSILFVWLRLYYWKVKRKILGFDKFVR